MTICAMCRKKVSIEGKVSRASTCPHCGAYLHSCVNCKFYSPGKHNDCKEPQAEYVSDKRSSNFCDYFVFNESRSNDLDFNKASSESSIEKDKKNARDRFDKLFGE